MSKSNNAAPVLPAVDALDDAALEALLTHARAVQEARGNAEQRAAALLKAEYAESITDFVTKVIANQEPQKSDKSDWVGYGARGINVVVDGHAFTVSVTITDTAAKQARAEERKVEEAIALLAAKQVKADA